MFYIYEMIYLEYNKLNTESTILFRNSNTVIYHVFFPRLSILAVTIMPKESMY